MFENLDVDKSGFIDGKEMVKKYEEEVEIVGIFSDKDKKKRQFRYEFKQEDWEAIIGETDVDGDGKIGYAEFVTLVLFPKILSGFFDHPMTLFPMMLQKQQEGTF